MLLIDKVVNCDSHLLKELKTFRSPKEVERYFIRRISTNTASLSASCFTRLIIPYVAAGLKFFTHSAEFLDIVSPGISPYHIETSSLHKRVRDLIKERDSDFPPHSPHFPRLCKPGDG